MKELIDIRGPEAYPASGSILTALLMFLLVFFVAGIIVYVRSKRQEKSVALTPKQKALECLDEIKKKNLIQSGKVDEFSTELSSALRVFIEEHFQLKALEQTTNEFFDSIKHSSQFTLEQRDQLKKIYEHCDQAKYAKGTFSIDVADQMINIAMQYVQNVGDCKEPESVV